MAETQSPELSELYKFNETYGTIDPADYDDVAVLVDQGIRSALNVQEEVHPSTPMGRMIEWLAIHFTNVLGLNVQNSNQLLLNAAAGQQLDAMAQWFQLKRKGARYTIVKATVTSNSSSDVVLEAGTRARTEAGDYFALSQTITIDSTTKKNENAYFTAITAGAVPCDVGALNIIDTPVDGWESVYNETAGTVGNNIETDDSLRERIANDRTTAIGFLGAIKNAIDAIPGVISNMVIENNTGAELAVSGVPLAAHSIFACVKYDGTQETESAIAKAIFDNKPCGTGYTDIVGRTNVSNDENYRKVVEVSDAYGNTYKVTFFTPVSLQIVVNVSVMRRRYTGTNITQDVQDAIQDWFSTSQRKIGEQIFASDIISHIEEKVPGIVVVECTISDGGSDTGMSYLEVPAYQIGVFNAAGSVVQDITR